MEISRVNAGFLVPLFRAELAPSLRDSGLISNLAFPTLKRGANKHCAYGAGGRGKRRSPFHSPEKRTCSEQAFDSYLSHDRVAIAGPGHAPFKMTSLAADYCGWRRSSKSTTRSISASGAALPVQISNWRAPCWTNISRPEMTARPRALASLRSGVSSGV